jgi:transposase-like protein
MVEICGRRHPRTQRLLCSAPDQDSLAFVSWKDRKAILPGIKAIYRAENAEMALVRLEEFEAEWGKRYPAIGQTWRRAWEHVVPILPSHRPSPLLAQDHQNTWQLSK